MLGTATKENATLTQTLTLALALTLSLTLTLTLTLTSSLTLIGSYKVLNNTFLISLSIAEQKKHTFLAGLK